MNRCDFILQQLKLMQLDQSQIRRNRQKYTLELRKQTREQIFMKRRNLVIEKSAMMQEQDLNEAPIITVLDERFRNIIQQAVKRNYKKEELAAMIAALTSTNPIEKHVSVIAVRKIISIQENQDAVQAALDKGVLQIIIELLKLKEYPHIRFESSWILSNIAAGTSQHCIQVVQNKGLQPLFQLLTESHFKLNQQAIWAIGNIAGDSIKMRDQILKQYGLAPLIKLVEKSTHKSIIKLSAWAISNLCRGTPLPKYQMIKKGIPIMGKIILSQVLPDEELSDCLWAISSHTNDGQKTRIQNIVQIPNFVPFLINLCKISTKPAVQVPSLRIIGNISVGNQLHTEQILKGGGLDLLCYLLEKQKKTTRRQACWILSNICGGTASQVKQVIFRTDLITKLAGMLWSDQIDIKKQICFIFKNISLVGEKIIVMDIIKRLNVTEGIISLIKENDNKQILIPGLKCLYELLCVGVQQNGENCVLQQISAIPGCLLRLQQLQHHNSQETYQCVVKIFQMFFQLQQTSTI